MSLERHGTLLKNMLMLSSKNPSQVVIFHSKVPIIVIICKLKPKLIYWVTMLWISA